MPAGDRGDEDRRFCSERSLLVDGNGIPLGTVVASANRHGFPLLRPTMERLGRSGFRLPSGITGPLDAAGYDSVKTCGLLDELSCEAEVATKGSEPHTRGGTP